MLNIDIFQTVTKIINGYKNERFNYIDILKKTNTENIEVQRYRLEQFFFFLKKWNFVENVNGKKPFILKNEIPLGMVKYLCTFTDLNEIEREELKNRYFRSEKLKKVKSIINI